MRVVIQRVTHAEVLINEKVKAAIGAGLLVLAGYEDGDSKDDIDWVCSKIVQLRVFNDDNGVMNMSLLDLHYDLLLVSQFTLHASTKKGNRPSYIRASKPDIAVPLYKMTIEKLSALMNRTIETGEFGADMQVSLVNDGPVTIIIDSKNKE